MFVGQAASEEEPLTQSQEEDEEDEEEDEEEEEDERNERRMELAIMQRSKDSLLKTNHTNKNAKTK